MLTVSIVGPGDIIISSVLANVGTGTGNEIGLSLVVPSGGNSYKIGKAPVQGRKNSIGDNACSHENVKGNVFCVPQGLFTSKVWNTVSLWLSENSRVKTSVSTSAYYIGTKRFGTDFLVWGETFSAKTLKIYDKNSSGVNLTNVQSAYSWKLRGSNTYVMTLTRFEYVYATRKTNITKTQYEYEFNYPLMTSYRWRKQTVLEFGPPINSAWSSWIPCSASTYRYVVPTTAVAVVREELNIDLILSMFKLTVLNCEIAPENKFIFGDLAQTAANNTRYLDINTSMYLADFFKIRQLVGSLSGVFRGRPNLRKLSGAYLALKYGVNLTIQDTKEIATAMQRALRMTDELPFGVAHSRASEVLPLTSSFPGKNISALREYNFKMYYNQVEGPLMDQIRWLYTWDFLPTFTNVWDFIPFSFVVDWFVGVEDQLARIDHATYIHTLKVISCLATTRTSVSVPVKTLFSGSTAGLSLGGTLEFVFYERTILDTPPQPISRFDVPTSFSHWLEGSSLLIQRLG